MPRIVEIKDQSPLLVRPEDTVHGVVAVCRCGLSSNWPYCTGAHKATRGEEPDKLYHYDRELPQGEPRRHEVDPESFGPHGPEAEAKAVSAEAGGPSPSGHGAGATPMRPPRPAAQHPPAPRTTTGTEPAQGPR